MKFLGIDHGNVRIGTAISDESGSLAKPLGILTHVSREMDAEQIRLMAENQECGAIVVGIPYDGDGSIGPRARSVLRFVEQLRLSCQVPILTWDESFSSQKTLDISLRLGKSRKSRREPLDDWAAAVILQSFLDHHAGRVGDENES